VIWFSKQSAVELGFLHGRNLRPEGPWIAVGAMGYIAQGVTVTNFCFPLWWVILLIDFMTKLTANYPVFI
jgi:hypothetical protein